MKCGREPWSTGAANRGQPVRGARTVVNRCGEPWSTGAGAQTVVNRCGEPWSTGAGARTVVNRCGKRGQPVRKRGQPVRKTRSAGAETVVNRCGKRGQRVRRNMDLANVSRGFANVPDLPDPPDPSRKGRREEDRWSACFAADAARRHRRFPDLSFVLRRAELSPGFESVETVRGDRGFSPPATVASRTLPLR